MYLKLLIRISLLLAFSSLASVRMRAEPVELAFAARYGSSTWRVFWVNRELRKMLQTMFMKMLRLNSNIYVQWGSDGGLGSQTHERSEPRCPEPSLSDWLTHCSGQVCCAGPTCGVNEETPPETAQRKLQSCFKAELLWLFFYSEHTQNIVAGAMQHIQVTTHTHITVHIKGQKHNLLVRSRFFLFLNKWNK